MSCAEPYPAIYLCEATWNTKLQLTGWANTVYQKNNRLDVAMWIRYNGEKDEYWAYHCVGSYPLSSCSRNGPQYSVTWYTSNVDPNPSPQVCLDATGWAYYLKNTNGQTARVQSKYLTCDQVWAPGQVAPVGLAATMA